MIQKTAALSLRRASNQISSIILNTFRKMSTAQDDVIFQEVQNKGIILLNRPKALNSLNLSMVTKIYPVLKDWESKKLLVVVKGSGEKAFCAGGDVKAVVEAARRGEKLGQEFFKYEYLTNALIGSYKIPYVAIIDGIVMGGGVGLSVHGKYRVATEKTLFAMPETQIGLFPDVGGSYFLPRLNGRLGCYLALTGQRLKGSDVLKAGIATHFCESKDLADLEKDLLECANSNHVQSILEKYSKKDNAEFSWAPHLEKINHCFAGTTIEEIVSRLEKDGSKWAQDTLATLNKMSPTSLKVSLRELELGKNLTLPECLQMEYRLVLSCLQKNDFIEGVRALLIDKDQSPKWNPATLSQVTDDLVDSHFSKLPEEQELKHKL